MKVQALTGVAQLTGHHPHKEKGHGFNSRSGNMPGLQAQSPVRELMRGNPSMFLTSMFLSFSLPFPPSKNE